MEITWLGQACFRIKGKESTIITDPFDDTSERSLRKLGAKIVTVSHDQPENSFTSGGGDDAKVLRGPGEYEISGVFIYGIRAFRDSDKGKTRGKNTIYLMEMEGIKVCHLGDLGHALSAAQVEEISDTDILLVPVGDAPTIDASSVAEITNVISPKIVIPMHYQTDANKANSNPLDKFMKEMGVGQVSPLPKLVVNKSSLPIETQVIVLEHKQ